MEEPISPKTRIAFCIISCILLFFSLLSHIYARAITPVGNTFTYITEGFWQDINSYFAWTVQAQQGHILFTSLYTSEPGHTWFFHPVFLIMGLLNRYGHIPLWVVWYGFRIGANIFLLWSIYKFVVHFTKTNVQLMSSFILIVLGSGLGWLVGDHAADVLYTEMSIFQILRWPIIFSLALSLFLWSLLLTKKLFAKPNYKTALGLGLTLFGLIFIHLYDIVTYAGITLVWFLISATLDSKTYSTLTIKRLLAAGILPIMGMVYYFYFFTHDWVWYMNSQVKMLSPSPWSYILGFGLPGLLALIASVWMLYKKRLGLTNLLLISWIGINAILLYSPLGFQRRLVLGLIVPIGILGGQIIAIAYEKLGRIRIMEIKILAYTIAVAGLVITTGTNYVVIKQDMVRAATNALPQQLDTATTKSFDWIAQQRLGQNDIILTSLIIGNFLPRYTGAHVYMGHWAQTILLAEKRRLVQSFLSGNMNIASQKEFITQNNIAYIYYGPEEQRMGTNWINSYTNLYLPVYKDGPITIYKVNYEQ